MTELDEKLINIFDDDIGYLMLQMSDEDKKKEINLEILNKIDKRVQKYYSMQNLHEDSSSQAIFDVMMLLKDIEH